MEWHRLLNDGSCSTQAELARKLDVTPARVTQVLRLLKLSPKVREVIMALGDPLPRPLTTERKLRSLVDLTYDEQERLLETPQSTLNRLQRVAQEVSGALNAAQQAVRAANRG